MTDQTIQWLRGLAEKGGKGVVNNIDARCLGRIADALEQRDALAKALANLLEFAQTQGDFKNGVVHNCIDEGEVWASGVFDESHAALAAVSTTGEAP